MTDREFLLDCLRDGAWHSTAELLRYSMLERGCGMTVHSRISDLRAQGLNVEYRRVDGRRGDAHQYRLVKTVRESERESDQAPARSPGPSVAGPSRPPREPVFSEEGAPAPAQLTVWEAA